MLRAQGKGKIHPTHMGKYTQIKNNKGKGSIKKIMLAHPHICLRSWQAFNRGSSFDGVNSCCPHHINLLKISYLSCHKHRYTFALLHGRIVTATLLQLHCHSDITQQRYTLRLDHAWAVYLMLCQTPSQ